MAQTEELANGAANGVAQPDNGAAKKLSKAEKEKERRKKKKLNKQQRRCGVPSGCQLGCVPIRGKGPSSGACSFPATCMWHSYELHTGSLALTARGLLHVDSTAGSKASRAAREAAARH